MPIDTQLYLKLRITILIEHHGLLRIQRICHHATQSRSSAIRCPRMCATVQRHRETRFPADLPNGYIDLSENNSNDDEIQIQTVSKSVDGEWRQHFSFCFVVGRNLFSCAPRNGAQQQNRCVIRAQNRKRREGNIQSELSCVALITARHSVQMQKK